MIPRMEMVVIVKGMAKIKARITKGWTVWKYIVTSLGFIIKEAST
jgi:hypothetical protein